MIDLLGCEFEIRAMADESRSVDVIASTAAMDSYGEIVEQDWILERFLANPIVLYAHNRWDALPIGCADRVRVEDGALQMRLNFVTGDANPLAEQVWQSIKQKSLRTVSVGFAPGDYRIEKRDGVEVLVLSKNELHEISVVPIPANPEAVMRMRAKAFGKSQQTVAERATSAAPKESPQMKTLFASLGLAENASEAEVLAAIAPHRELSNQLALVTGKSAPSDQLGVVHAWKQASAQYDVVSADLAAVRAAQDKTDRTKAYDDAQKDGRLSPDTRAKFEVELASLPLSGLRSCLAALPKLVNPTTTQPTPPKGDADALSLSADELVICKQLAITPAQFAATKAANAARTGV